MASYHLSVSVVSRGSGRSAVAAAAYRACARIENKRDGLVHDYTRKQGLLHQEVVLPEHAPERFLDRSVLWNEVERIERSQSAQLCREYVIALPHELSDEQRVECAREFARSLAAEGMVADLCVHDADNDGHNVHAHILCPMRGVDENGFLSKAVNVYAVRDRSGREEQMTAVELKDAKARGEEWEKVYTYKKGGEKRLLTSSEAARWDGCKRQGKTPVQESRYLVDWNEKTKVEEWRARWAGMQNSWLERVGSSERVDHRSFERRALEAIPQVHEGARVRAMERKAERQAARDGVEYAPVTDRRAQNVAAIERNSIMQRMVAARNKLAHAVEVLSQSAKEGLAREIGQWRERAERARAIVMQPHRAPSKKAQAEIGEIYRSQEKSRLSAVQERLLRMKHLTTSWIQNVDQDVAALVPLKRERRFVAEHKAEIKKAREVRESRRPKGSYSAPSQRRAVGRSKQQAASQHRVERHPRSRGMSR